MSIGIHTGGLLILCSYCCLLSWSPIWPKLAPCSPPRPPKLCCVITAFSSLQVFVRLLLWGGFQLLISQNEDECFLTLPQVFRKEREKGLPAFPCPLWWGGPPVPGGFGAGGSGSRARLQEQPPALSRVVGAEQHAHCFWNWPESCCLRNPRLKKILIKYIYFSLSLYIIYIYIYIYMCI